MRYINSDKYNTNVKVGDVLQRVSGEGSYSIVGRNYVVTALTRHDIKLMPHSDNDQKLKTSSGGFSISKNPKKSEWMLIWGSNDDYDLF